MSVVAVVPACGGAAARPTATHAVRIHSVDWGDVAVPGSVCDGSEPIQLRAGRATVDAPPALHAGTPRVTVSASHPVYGNLTGAGQDEAAVNVWCDDTTGTADGQLADSWVIYNADSGSLRVLGTLTPAPAAAAGVHVSYFDTGPGGITMAPGKITATELSYGPEDATCCPSVRTTGVWIYADGVLRATAPSRSNPRG